MYVIQSQHSRPNVQITIFMTCLIFADTGSRILLPPLSLSRRVIPSPKIALNFNGQVNYRELAQRPCLLYAKNLILIYAQFHLLLPEHHRYCQNSYLNNLPRACSTKTLYLFAALCYITLCFSCWQCLYGAASSCNYNFVFFRCKYEGWGNFFLMGCNVNTIWSQSIWVSLLRPKKKQTQNKTKVCFTYPRT